jgi:hypothetical protein
MDKKILFIRTASCMIPAAMIVCIASAIAIIPQENAFGNANSVPSWIYDATKRAQNDNV